MLISYNWLKEYTGETTKTAKEAADLLEAHSFEIEGLEEGTDDSVIEIDILPNRASDSLCHRGIARELATVTGVPLEKDPLANTPELKDLDQIKINIEDEEACPRFTASLISGIEVKESPDWLKARLNTIGQRSINNIVDATNYVMFAMGEPVHAYDADLFPQVEGKWKFDIRFAKEGESVGLLAEGGKDEDRAVELDGSELLIVDGSSNTPIGLAGVKGGSHAVVHEGTKNIIIEAAHFHPTVVRKTARRLGIVIDASKRFENEPSRELPPFAQTEIVKLITDIAGGEYVGTVDEYLVKQEKIEVEVSVERVNSHLGLSLSVDEMVDILKRVGCEVDSDSDSIKATGPFERTDLNIEEDFIEEIGRVYGYHHIEAISPTPETLSAVNKKHYYSEEIRGVLIDLGFSEVITSSFRKKDKVQLKNALASDKSFLRSSLRKNIEEALDKNAGFTDLLGSTDTRIFEIGTVFYSDDNTIKEHVSLALGVRLKTSGYSGKEDKVVQETVKELSEKIGSSIKFEVSKGVAECNISELLGSLTDQSEYKKADVSEDMAYRPFSQYPSVSRDIAMWVGEETSRDEVEKTLNESAGDLRVRTTFVDEFSKDGKISFAFRLVFQSFDKTLTDIEVNKVMDTINEAVAKNEWEVR